MHFLLIDRISSLATTFCKYQTNTEQDNLLLNQTLLKVIQIIQQVEYVLKVNLMKKLDYSVSLLSSMLVLQTIYTPKHNKVFS